MKDYPYTRDNLYYVVLKKQQRATLKLLLLLLVVVVVVVAIVNGGVVKWIVFYDEVKRIGVDEKSSGNSRHLSRGSDVD